MRGSVSNATGQDNRIIRGKLPQEKESGKPSHSIYEKNLLDDRVPTNAIELKLKYTIPIESEIEEKEIFFKSIWYISVDPRGQIYVPDARMCVVYEFTKDGKLLSKYDKRGQGPGDMQNPFNVLFYKDQIIVMDNSLGRITYFDREWKYIRSVTFIKGYKPFGIAEDGNIYCTDPSREKIISVLNPNGNQIKSYGEIIYPEKKESPLNEVIMRLSPTGTVWVGFATLGIVREYSDNGNIKNEVNILEVSSKLVKSNKEENDEFNKRGINAHYPLIKCFAFINDDVYVTGGGLVKPIYQIDKNRKIKNIFYIKPQFMVENVCFYTALDQSNKEEFYILIRNDSEESIGVYGRK